MIGAWLFAVIIILLTAVVAIPCGALLHFASQHSGRALLAALAVVVLVIVPLYAVVMAGYAWEPLCAWLGVEP